VCSENDTECGGAVTGQTRDVSNVPVSRRVLVTSRHVIRASRFGLGTQRFVYIPGINYTDVLLQVLLDMRCPVIVCLGTRSMLLHAWNQQDKVNKLLISQMIFHVK
jgi:hypothetical protein